MNKTEKVVRALQKVAAGIDAAALKRILPTNRNTFMTAATGTPRAYDSQIPDSSAWKGVQSMYQKGVNTIAEHPLMKRFAQAVNDHDTRVARAEPARLIRFAYPDYFKRQANTHTSREQLDNDNMMKARLNSR